MLLDRNDWWIVCEPLGEADTLRAARAQEAVRRARAANVQEPSQTTAVETAAASPPANAPAASPTVETEVVPVAQEQESSVVHCCHGHGMQRRVFSNRSTYYLCHV